MNGIKRFQDSARRGFTLIEILVVLILISLILAISTVFFANTLPKARHRAAAREIVLTIKYARNLAASKNERQIVTFDLDAGSYGIKGRAEKMIPEETALVIYESDIHAEPIKKGQYHICYDTTGTGNWERISLIRGNRVIGIKADPILTAVIADEDQDKHHD